MISQLWYILSHHDDNNREFILTEVIILHVPSGWWRGLSTTTSMYVRWTLKHGQRTLIRTWWCNIRACRGTSFIFPLEGVDGRKLPRPPEPSKANTRTAGIDHPTSINKNTQPPQQQKREQLILPYLRGNQQWTVPKLDSFGQ